MSVIGVDLDGVVADFTQAFGDYVRNYGDPEDRNRHFPPPSCWHFGNWNLKGDFEDYYERFIHSGGYKRVPVIQGAVASLQAIRELGWKIHIITNRGTSEGATARNHKAIKNTLTWLAANDIPHDTLSFVKDKTAILCDVILEDAPHHLEAFIAKNKAGVAVTPDVIAMGQPYNKRFQYCDPLVIDFTYAQDWNDVVERVAYLDELRHGNGVEIAEDRLSR